MRSHLLYNADLLHEQAGAFTLEAGPFAGYGEILTGRSAADHVHGGKLRALEHGDVAHMEHVRKAQPCHFYWERFDFAGPHRSKALPDARQRKPADPVEQAAQGQRHIQSRKVKPAEGVYSGLHSIFFI
ncbi:hypothetical protein SDC9_72256 [bioreactor metagenome]|uniref:Uncharacterized protein n=1 Tax=bioreactor metagenome TaxID=1076179 RepID=A0A644YB27_9ZZZZ